MAGKVQPVPYPPSKETSALKLPSKSSDPLYVKVPDSELEVPTETLFKKNSHSISPVIGLQSPKSKSAL